MKTIKTFVAGMITTLVIQTALTVYGMTKKESEVKSDESN